MLKVYSKEWRDFITKLEVIKTKSNREVLCIECWQMLNCKQKIKHLKRLPDHEKFLLTSTKYASERQMLSLSKAQGKHVLKENGDEYIVTPFGPFNRQPIIQMEDQLGGGLSQQNQIQRFENQSRVGISFAQQPLNMTSNQVVSLQSQNKEQGNHQIISMPQTISFQKLHQRQSDGSGMIVKNFSDIQAGQVLGFQMTQSVLGQQQLQNESISRGVNQTLQNEPNQSASQLKEYGNVDSSLRSQTLPQYLRIHTQALPERATQNNFGSQNLQFSNLMVNQALFQNDALGRNHSGLIEKVMIQNHILPTSVQMKNQTLVTLPSQASKSTTALLQISAGHDALRSDTTSSHSCEEMQAFPIAAATSMMKDEQHSMDSSSQEGQSSSTSSCKYDNQVNGPNPKNGNPSQCLTADHLIQIQTDERLVEPKAKRICTEINNTIIQSATLLKQPSIKSLNSQIDANSYNQSEIKGLNPLPITFADVNAIEEKVQKLSAIIPVNGKLPSSSKSDSSSRQAEFKGYYMQENQVLHRRLDAINDKIEQICKVLEVLSHKKKNDESRVIPPSSKSFESEGIKEQSEQEAPSNGINFQSDKRGICSPSQLQAISASSRSVSQLGGAHPLQLNLQSGQIFTTNSQSQSLQPGALIQFTTQQPQPQIQSPQQIYSNPNAQLQQQIINFTNGQNLASMSNKSTIFQIGSTNGNGGDQIPIYIKTQFPSQQQSEVVVGTNESQQTCHTTQSNYQPSNNTQKSNISNQFGNFRGTSTQNNSAFRESIVHFQTAAPAKLVRQQFIIPTSQSGNMMIQQIQPTATSTGTVSGGFDGSSMLSTNGSGPQQTYQVRSVHNLMQQNLLNNNNAYQY